MVLIPFGEVGRYLGISGACCWQGRVAKETQAGEPENIITM